MVPQAGESMDNQPPTASMRAEGHRWCWEEAQCWNSGLDPENTEAILPIEASALTSLALSLGVPLETWAALQPTKNALLPQILQNGPCLETPIAFPTDTKPYV